MANPATKNGHIKIANELIEHFAKVNIPGQEMRIIWVLWRKTWGWEQGDRRKDWDWISITQFEKMTGMKKSNVHISLKSLLAKRLILKQDNLLKFNQNYNEWLLVKRLPLLVKSILPISQKTNKTGSQKTNNKYNKATIQKQSIFLKDKNFVLAYNGFKEMRRTKKKPLNGRAEQLVLGKLDKQDLETAIAMLDEATEKGWSSVFERKEPESDIYQQGIKILDLIKFNTPTYAKKVWKGIDLSAIKVALDSFYPDQLDLLPNGTAQVLSNLDEIKKHLTI